MARRVTKNTIVGKFEFVDDIEVDEDKEEITYKIDKRDIFLSQNTGKQKFLKKVITQFK